MKKYVIYRVILLIGVCMVFWYVGSINTYAKENDDFLRGGGTKYNPYLISSYEDVVKLRDAVDAGNNFNGVYFCQTTDILFPDGINWNPIGDLEHGFAGNYDGNGHTLSNIYCDDPHAGFFSLLVGEVRNLGIEDGCFSGDYIGSITSHGGATARIVNCYNKADVSGTGRAGGIADNYPGLIMFCWNLGCVTGTNESVVTAGITSYGEANVRNCYAVGADKLVSDETFTGEIADSQLLEWKEVSDYTWQSYKDMFEVYDEAKENAENNLVTRGNIVFMVYENGEFHFDQSKRQIHRLG